MATYATYFHMPTQGQQHETAVINTTHVNAPLALDMRYIARSTRDTKPTTTASRTPREQTTPTSHPLTTTPNSQATSPLFRLPAELRNIIYTHLFCPSTSTLAHLATEPTDLSVRRFNQTTTSISLYPALLSTCRRIHLEASQMLYTPHTFHAHPTLLTALPHLTSSSKPVLYSHLTALITRWQISLRLDTDPRFTAGQAKRAFSGAEYLEVRVWQAQFGACDLGVLRLFTGVRGVTVARVGGSVDVGAARWLEGVMMSEGGGEEGEACKCECECDWGDEREVLCGRCYRKLGWGVGEMDGR